MKWIQKKEINSDKNIPWFSKINDMTNASNSQRVYENIDDQIDTEPEKEFEQIARWEENTKENIKENDFRENQYLTADTKKTSFSTTQEKVNNNHEIKYFQNLPHYTQNKNENLEPNYRYENLNFAKESKAFDNVQENKSSELSASKRILNHIEKGLQEQNNYAIHSQELTERLKNKEIFSKSEFDKSNVTENEESYFSKIKHKHNERLNFKTPWLEKTKKEEKEKLSWLKKYEIIENENIIPADKIGKITDSYKSYNQSSRHENKSDCSFQKINAIPVNDADYFIDNIEFSKNFDFENDPSLTTPLESAGPLLENLPAIDKNEDFKENKKPVFNVPIINGLADSIQKPKVHIDENIFEKEESENKEEDINIGVDYDQTNDNQHILENDKEEEISIEKTLPATKEANQVKNQSSNYERASITPIIQLTRQYNLPFSLLSKQENLSAARNNEETQSIIDTLETTLRQFNIEGRVVGIQTGPIITRYEVKMPPGVKVNKILALTDELAMALEALKVRIEAPIPGRSTVGIEIPNKKRSLVLLGDLINNDSYKETNKALPLPMGKDIAGNLVIEDLSRMPHILIAGATGSGKSVAVNSFISSLILTKSPEEVRFLLVDPKLVELSHYNDIPHLLHPVITDSQKAILALNWAVEEMERRYEDLAELRVRDIRTYNEKINEYREENKSDKENRPLMPYIVVLIDELGDLMLVAGKEVEASIIRLSQKARAVGIHLILATQRPSVDVITALIKANCPARIALQVAQKTDSRTILDSNGAEQLIGAGDMLFKHPSHTALLRVQAPLVYDEEVDDIVQYVKDLGRPSYITLEDPKSNNGSLDIGEEDLFEEAWQIIIESQKASASYLQRRLRIGYNRAARIIEAMEARGYIGPQIGSKPREILLNP
ncbi:MAG: DNA translocase FtsK [Spirochaetia bacterium]|nr:DNA translocase FtsK [Spirochaetia bacterium]